MKKITLLIIIALSFYSTQNNAQTLDSNAVDGKIYIKIKDYSAFVDLTYSGGDASGLPTEIKNIVNTYSVSSIVRPFIAAGNNKLDRIFKVSFNNFNKVNDVIRAFGSVGYVEYSEKIPIDKVSCTNDPQTWGTPANNYHLNLIQACNAWSINQGSNSVRVAILDNECDVNHPDLVGRVSTWYDVADGDNNVLGTASLNHGTHVTGIVGANTNNSLGVASLGRGLDLIFGKIAQNSTGQLTAGYPAMIWAVNNGARVINCSWGGFYFSQTNYLIVNWVLSQNVIICAAAGNNNINAPTFPASFPGVYAVGATDPNDNKAWFSNFGSWVDISAPGVNIFSTVSSAVAGPNAYTSMSGTSMATPIVSALCGLLISNNLSYSPSMVLNCINSTAVLPIGGSSQMGAGRINAFAALQCSGGAGNSVQFSVSANHVCNGSSVSFTDNSITTSPITNWSWSFSNLTNTLTSNMQNPTITFNTPGIYSAILTFTTASSQTFTTHYPTDINVVGLNNAVFSSTGSYCKNNEAQISLTYDRFPELVINYNINGGINNTYSISNQYSSTQEIILNTPNTPNMVVNIISVSDNVVTCPTSISFNTVLVDCCPNLVFNGDFEMDNIGFTSDLIDCPLANAPGYRNIYYYANYSPSPFTARGANYLHIDGPTTDDAGPSQVGTCLPGISMPSHVMPGVGVILYEGTANLIAGSNYIFSFAHSNPNANFINWYTPVIFPFYQSIFRVSLKNSSGTVFTNTYIPNPTNNNQWYQYKRDLSGSITITDTYSVTIEQMDYFDNVAFDYFFDDVSINAINTLTSSVTPSLTNLCVGNNINLTTSSGNAISPLTYSWSSTPSASYPNTQSINSFISTSTTFTSSITDVNRCVTNATATVNLLGNPVITATASSPTVCISNPNSVLTANGAANYVWNSGTATISGNPITVNPSATTQYTVTGTTTAGCTNTAVILVTYTTCPGSCEGCTNSLSGTITSNPPSGLSYCVNNDIVIQGNVNFNSSEFKFAPGVKVIVDNNAVLSISRSHLYACNKFWQGIVIKDNITGGPGTGRVIITGNSLIEDARIAVDVPNHLTTALPAGQYIVLINGAILNKDSIGVRINQYQPAVSAPYLFSIRNSVFTCRNIPYTVTAPFITSAGSVGNVKATASNPGLPLASPYIDEAVYTTVNTWYGMPSFYGVQLINVGQTQNPTASSPNYFQVQIGEAASNLFNVFDRLLICVDAKSSNFTCINNVFQNTFAYGKGSQIGGHAINAYSVENLNNRLQVINGASDGTLNNKFFNCFRAILSSNYYEHNIQYCDVRSTQTNPAPLTYLNRIGKYGFYMTTNRFRKVTVNNNSLYNIESAVVFNANYSALNIPPAISSANAQYSGQIDVNYNTIQPNVGTAPITTQYVSNAIYIANVNSTGALNLVPNTTVNTYNNSISSVYRGIYVSNWVKKDVRTISNCITLKNDPYPGPPLQFGVNHTNNTGSSAYSNLIYNNNITGTGITNSQMKGAYSSMSMNEYMRCNNVMSTYSGIEFNGVPSNPGTLIGNIMQNHTYGFVLNNNAAIGAIGSPSQPADNKWMGTWINPNFKTATLGGSSSQTSHMYVRGASGTITNPDGSGYTFGGPISPTDYYGMSVGSIIPATGPYYLCPSIGACIPPNDGGNGGIMPGVVQQTISSTDIQLMEKIALDQMPYTVNPNESKFIGKNHLYRALRADSTLMATSPVLQNFYASSQTTVRETLASIDDKLSDGNIISSQNDVTALNPQNNIEANYKVFYSSYLNYLNDTLSSTDSTNILSLANGCPTVDGAIVYNARALYNSIYSVVEQFNDNCTSSAQGSRLGNFSGVQKWDADKKPFDAIMYPVPSSGDVNICPLGIIEGNLKVIVLDITGKVVFDKALQITNGLCNFKLNLNTGTYLVKIINSNTNESINKKLIMQK